MVSSLSNLVNNLAKQIHQIKSKNERDNEKCETCGIKYKESACFLEYINLRDSLIKYKCFCLWIIKKQKRKTKATFLIMVSISLFCCCEKVFIYTDIRMIGKNSMQFHYLKRRFLQSPKHAIHYWSRIRVR